MPAVKKKLIIEQGATYNKRFIRRTASKRPINMTNYNAKFIIKTAIGGSTLTEATTQNGKIVIDGLNGIIDIKFTDEETALFAFTKGYYNLTVEDVAGNVIRLAEGDIIVSPSV